MNQLKYYRMKAGISQSELATSIGVSQRHIAFLESGDRMPSLDLAYKISNIFNVSIEEIFLGSKCTKSTQN